MKTAFDAHCWAEIDLDALVHNFHLIREKASPAAVCAVVKADAYGAKQYQESKKRSIEC